MEPNGNPPSEREWTMAEREEFFAGQDAITGLLNGETIRNSQFISFERYISIEDAYIMFNRGIHITKIIPPAQGWPIAMHCPLCKETTFILSPWAIKPERGDYFKMKNTCGSEAMSLTHNLILARDTILQKLTLRPLPMNGFGE